MTRYKVDNVVLDTAKAQESWKDDGVWVNGNRVSVATGDQWIDEKLHRSAKGRYWIETIYRISGCTDDARLVDHSEAAHWLYLNGHDLPEDLEAYEDEVSE